MISIFAQGFLLQASLILALGAQNIFVLNSGLQKQRHFLVAFVCSVCDAALIFVGVLGVATIFVEYPLLKICFGIAGVGFLLLYGVLKLKEAKSGIKVSKESVHISSGRQAVVTSLAFSLLNPHVYLDTVVLIGGYSAKFDLLSERFFFGFGALSFSTLWFFGLVFLASVFSGILNNPRSMRMVAFVSGLILTLLAFKLGSEVFGWIENF